jgi:hypothetical protein
LSYYNSMKKAGIIILVVGLAITLFTGFNFVTREKVLDVGELQISRDKKHNLSWSPLVGVVVMVIGGGILLFGVMKR